jgi:hypothetical protein
MIQQVTLKYRYGKEGWRLLLLFRLLSREGALVAVPLPVAAAVPIVGAVAVALGAGLGGGAEAAGARGRAGTGLTTLEIGARAVPGAVRVVHKRSATGAVVASHSALLLIVVVVAVVQLVVHQDTHDQQQGNGSHASSNLGHSCSVLVLT